MSASASSGQFGGRHVSEALWGPLEALAQAHEQASRDDDFWAQYDHALGARGARPTPLVALPRLSASLGGATLWLKREDLGEGGSFCSSLALYMALIAKRMGRAGLVTESATGDFGVALGAAGAWLGLHVRVYMSREDLQREPAQARWMQRLGVELISVDAPGRGRRGACAEAMRYWLGCHHDTLYVTSMLASPDPYPTLIARALRVIGAEARAQLRRLQVAPSHLIAPVGSGGFAAGLLAPFMDTPEVALIGVQALGDPAHHKGGAPLLRGRPGVLHGTLSLTLQDAEGLVPWPHCAAAGMCMANVGPQHAWWASQEKVRYHAHTDLDAARAIDRLARQEGIVLALESGYALAHALQLAPSLAKDQHVLIGASGHGARDMGCLDALLEHEV